MQSLWFGLMVNVCNFVNYWLHCPSDTSSPTLPMVNLS
ncbi:Cysteine--tRNA ligase [Frankliniella fusca]|nr:Cysteine--tRNA ligase [Frankliniella fusca]KAK3914698.1 Cysteine--tRNA ligase [Frankliniella fusca]KAK3920410.1 Cysteine--tRNA ligase [Frankliniella fusca]KAK3922007.1 Cysteine--tRNA ligase [Frankliniella fusca]KAK3922074.1 Cysteine--tRNA ligase [Frankliniella fusca]